MSQHDPSRPVAAPLAVTLPADAAPGPGVVHATSGTLDRRSFLALGTGATAAGLLGVGAFATPAAAATTRAAAAQPLSVGFLENSGTWNLRQLPWEAAALPADWTGRVIPARSLPLGEQVLAGESVVLKVYGLYPNATLTGSEGIAGTNLLVRFTTEDESTVDQIAWGLRRTPFSSGQRASQIIRLGLHGELTLGVEVTATAEARRAGAAARLLGTQAEPQRLVYRSTFTVDWGDAPKLQRGFYFLGLGPATFEDPVAIPGRPRAQRTDLRSILIAVDTVIGAPAR